MLPQESPLAAEGGARVYIFTHKFEKFKKFNFNIISTPPPP